MAEKEAKKRKRPASSIDAPNKRHLAAAVEAPASTRLKIGFSGETGHAPALISSPGLTAPAIPFLPYAKSRTGRRSSDAHHLSPNTHDLLLHSSKHPRLDYTATPIALDGHLSHYLAVFDPSTQQLQISPAHHLSLRSTLRRGGADGEQDTTRRTIRQQREDLGREFGTRKAKKAILSKTVNAITKTGEKTRKDDVQSAVLESMAHAAASGLSAEEQAAAQFAAKPIPTPDLTADTVEGVYAFDTLIPPSHARLIPTKDWLELAESHPEPEFSHRFITKRFESTMRSDDTYRLQALRYLHLLLQFHDALSSGSRGSKKIPKREVLDTRLPDWPGPLVNAVRTRFANPANELPKWHLDRFYTHICALALYVDRWDTDVVALKEALRVDGKVLLQYFKELGCRIAGFTERERENWGLKKGEVAGRKMARLRVPLEFPKPRVGRR